MSDFFYAYAHDSRPAPIPHDEIRTRKCARCGADFETRSRTKKRCDGCAPVERAVRQTRANERAKARRRSTREQKG